MKEVRIIQVLVDGDNNVLGLSDDNRMYIWDENVARWELLLVKNG